MATTPRTSAACFITSPSAFTIADFSTAITIFQALLSHSIKVFFVLYGEKQQKRLSSSAEQNLFDALPSDFGRQDYIKAAKKLGINERTVKDM